LSFRKEGLAKYGRDKRPYFQYLPIYNGCYFVIVSRVCHKTESAMVLRFCSAAGVRAHSAGMVFKEYVFGF
jgi:hypothetical protein